MRSFNALQSPQKSFCQLKLLQDTQNARHVQMPFSDSDILDLQDAFLNNGLHYIKVDDLKSGRSLIRLFLGSLNVYHNTASLTILPEPLDPAVTDLYVELLMGGTLDARASHKLEEFFLERFYHDFLWIEITDALIKNSWVTEFFKRITDFRLDQLIPILVVSYKN